MLKRLLKKYPFFLVLLPVFILTHIEREYHGLIDYSLVYDLFLFLLVIPSVVYGFPWLLTRSNRKAGILSLAILLVYYIFGEPKDTLKASWPGTVWQSYTFLLIVFLVALIVVAVLITRNNWQF